MKAIIPAILCSTALLATVSYDVDAREATRTRCRAVMKVDGTMLRSKVDLDVKNLTPGDLFSCLVVSAAGQKISGPHTVNEFGEIECDFDSSPKAIARGATPIGKGFARPGNVTGQLVDDQGFVVAGSTAKCRIQRKGR